MKPLFPSAIYVNRKPNTLVDATHGDKPSEPLTEHRAWKSGYKLFQKARRTGCELPLIFGYTASLTFWALAREITVSKSTTTYRFSGLRTVPRGYQRRDLSVASSRRALSNDFIRPYAIVQTPPFIDSKGAQQAPVRKAWRDDPQTAAKIMKNAFPSRKDYDSVLTQLSESIHQANSVAPKAWAVTLFPGGFRLNVGRVEVLTALGGEVSLLMHGARHTLPRELRNYIQRAHFKSVPGDKCFFQGSAQQFRVNRQDLLSAHHSFIAKAGRTTTGRPVIGTRYRASHSPGLVDLADAVADSQDASISIPRVSDQEYVNTLNKLDSLDGRYEGLVRKEQTYLRQKLVGGRTKAKCGLCDKEFPVELLVAAHIKSRAKCSDKEKRDLANVVLMCEFGCDDLFEQGYVSVSDGRIVRNKQRTMTKTVSRYVRTLVGKQCGYWKKTNAPYFAWRKDQTS